MHWKMHVRFGEDSFEPSWFGFVTLLLSIGALFGIKAAYFYWSGNILGKDYNERLAKIDFWLLLIGVNVLFGPQHIIGFQGMPRRIYDYPDIFEKWNTISSYGSIICLFSLFLFLYIIYQQITTEVFYHPKHYIQWSLDLVTPTAHTQDHHFNQIPIIC